MGQNAFRKAARELSWEGIADKTIAVYRRAIAGRRRRRRMPLRSVAAHRSGAKSTLSPDK
jgi:hypothetical protein